MVVPLSPTYSLLQPKQTLDLKMWSTGKKAPVKIYLETLPPFGLISQYGVSAGDDPVLDQYNETFKEKFELWKSNVKKILPGGVN